MSHRGQEAKSNAELPEIDMQRPLTCVFQFRIENVHGLDPATSKLHPQFSPSRSLVELRSFVHEFQPFRNFEAVKACGTPAVVEPFNGRERRIPGT